jgi:hypothetical protein
VASHHKLTVEGGEAKSYYIFLVAMWSVYTAASQNKLTVDEADDNYIDLSV